jgi:hypothetical protein
MEALLRSGSPYAMETADNHGKDGGGVLWV